MDKRVPAIVDEFGAMCRTNIGNSAWQELHYQSRAYYFEHIAQEAKNHGMVPFIWDANGDVMNRKSNIVGDQKAYDGLIKGANAGKYPF